ncbi:MAG: SH3 domain-containing protein [Treponema sp.]|jgi:hypothetical protein|nr:SH3 domain-containing protein [Treponema sp.]
MIRKIIFSLLILILISCSNRQGKKENTGEGNNGTASLAGIENKSEAIEVFDVKYVSSKDGLRVRDKPGITGNILGVLPYKGKVLIAQKTIDTSTIDGITDCWYLTEINGMEGWVFGGYLQESDPNMEIDEYRINNPEFYKIAFSEGVSDFDRGMIMYNTSDLYQTEKDFSGYETHPFEKYKGKWIQEGRWLEGWHDERLNEKITLEIFVDGSDYKFIYNSYGENYAGKLYYFPATKFSIILSEDLSERYGLGEAGISPDDNKWHTSIWFESSVFYYVRMDD